MGKALGLAAVIVVLAIFLPRLLDAVQTFLLRFFEIAIKVLGNLEH